MDNTGWIVLRRDIKNHWIWSKPRKLRMWLDIVMMANYEDSTISFKGFQVHLNRGQFATSLRILSSKLGCAKQTLITFLRELESSKMISMVCVQRKYSILTILNYGLYAPGSVENMVASEDKKSDSSRAIQLEIEDDSEIENSKIRPLKSEKLDHLLNNNT